MAFRSARRVHARRDARLAAHRARNLDGARVELQSLISVPRGNQVRLRAAASLATRFAFSNCATAPRTCRLEQLSACRRGRVGTVDCDQLNPKPLQKPEASLLHDEIAGEAGSIMRTPLPAIAFSISANPCAQ